MIKFIMKKILLFIQFIARIFRRALCCFKRQRRNSCDQAPLTTIGIVSNGEVINNHEAWEAWEEGANQDEKCSETEKHIRMYRQQRANLNQAKNEEEPPVDFFLDMTPRIVKQKKLLLKSQEIDSIAANNSLSLAPDPMFSTADLGVWDENQSWEAEADGDTDVLIALREQRRQEREQRLHEQQKRKNERIRQGSIS